jgi:hypothetical protein
LAAENARLRRVTFTAMILGFVPLLAPANEMSYDTEQFYNAAGDRRIHIDEVPEGVVLAAGMTATVQIDPRPTVSAVAALHEIHYTFITAHFKKSDGRYTSAGKTFGLRC